MKKVFYANSLMGGCHYVRCLLPMRELGADGDKTSLRSIALDNDTRARAVLAADIVVFHRPNDDRSLRAAELLRQQGKKIVMDNDDTYKGFDMTKLGRLFPQVDASIDRFAKFADLVTCSTEFLRQEYLKLNPNVVVLPNFVDPEDWPEYEDIQRNDGDKVRIGLVGSVGLHSDIGQFEWVLDELAKREDVQLVVFCLPPDKEETKQVRDFYKPEIDFWNAHNVEWQNFVSIADYRDTLNNLKLDMILIPREDIYFNRCKSNLKFLEASMLEIPVIAQGFTDGMSPYQVDPEDAKHMRIVVDNTKWMDEINRLIDDKDLRRDMGKKAREYVMGKYQIKDNIWRWEKAYASLYTSKD